MVPPPEGLINQSVTRAEKVKPLLTNQWCSGQPERFRHSPQAREDVNYPTINQGNASSNLALHPKHSSTPKHNGPVFDRTGGGLRRGHRSYAVRMSDSPLSPQEIRAAAAAHAELGPEYSDADWARWHRGGHASVRTGPWVGQG
jgi:hypothetical protein